MIFVTIAKLHSEGLSIGRLSALAGVKIETIRYYERIKLLRAPMRSRSGRRLYTNADVRALVFIRRARELGFSLGESGLLLRLADLKPTCREVREIAVPRLEDIRAKLKELRRIERLLYATVLRCSGGDSIDCPILNELDIDRTKAA